MKSRLFALSILFLLLLGQRASAQFQAPPEGGVRLGEAHTQRWQFGVEITAIGPIANVVVALPIPHEWPEQQVRIVELDASRSATVRYRTVQNSVRIMEVKIARMAAGEQARVLLTCDVTRRKQTMPAETSALVPPMLNYGSAMRIYLMPSPGIEAASSEIKTEAKRIAAGAGNAWNRAKAAHDWVQDKITYEEEAPLRGALTALRERTGDCDDMSSLFIALCRANGIPARTVRVPGHCYPEFCLADAEGNSHWFPSDVTGNREFCDIDEFRPIVQKGDNFHSLENKRQHYFAPVITAVPIGRSSEPELVWIERLISESPQ